MLRGFARDAGRLRPADPLTGPLEALVWIDLLDPSREEKTAIEDRLGLDVPTREEMAEIELSSRLYMQDGVVYMTAVLPARADGDDPVMGPVTFVLAAGRLITVRHHAPRVFDSFPARAERAPAGCDSGEGVLLGLLEEIVDRLADILEASGRDLDALSRSVFRAPDGAGVSRELRATLASIGRAGDLLSKLRDSLASLERLLVFLGQAETPGARSKEARDRVKILYRDVRSIADHAGFLSQKVTLLLEAVVGLVGIEQNGIIKIFSVAAVIFLPPTLVASIYGMNFAHMPELGWPWGYPLALGLMVLSALLPYLFFKRRGWL